MRDVQCKRCIEYKGNWCDKKRDDPDPDMVRDCHWFRTKTNADRIRMMTDEELADWLEARTCQWGWLDWLKQEVEE